ncbi:MAG: FGGY family carbohydrate kinase, partial [Chloroflexota bacterium]
MTPRPPALLGIDIGSSELRAGLVTPDGHLLGLERARYEMTIDSERGFAEQDPELWWTGLRAVTRLLLGRVEADIVGIAVDGHGPSLTPVDQLGRPTRPAITWLDRRAAAEQAELGAATGLLGWSLGILPAALWVERHEPEVAARTSWYLNSWEAVATRLTGVARTSLVPSQAWPVPDELGALGLPSDRIAEPVEAGRVVGRISAES